MGLTSPTFTQSFIMTPVYGKDILEIRETKDGGFNLEQMRDMMGTYSQMPQADKYSRYSL